MHSCPLFDIVFLFFFFLSLCPVGLSLLNQKTLKHGTNHLSIHFFDQGQEFIIFSKGCFNLTANFLIGNMPCIGVGRFRKFGGGEGGQGGPKSKQAHDVVLTLVRRHVPTRFLINQCQILTFLALTSDNIENSRIELKGIVLPVPSNQIKVVICGKYINLNKITKI